MNASFFIQLVDKYLTGIIGKVNERYNDKEKEMEMIHKDHLTAEYSVDMTWGSTDLNHSIVAADVVSTNSSLPLKHRGTISKANGKLPKVGIKYFKDEDDIDQINTMLSKGTPEATIVSKLFDDVGKVVKGVDIRNEILFLQALSSGVMLADDSNNTGTAIRVDFGFLEENQFNATTAAWTSANATPLDDIEQMFEKAYDDGNTIKHLWMERKYLSLMRKTDQCKILVANYMDQVITDKTALSTPSVSKLKQALEDEFEVTIHVIRYNARIEGRDGEYTNVNPWETGAIIATESDVVGRLVYGTLAEETKPVAGVSYVKSGNYTLVSKYSENDPLKEFTTAQARCLPVLDNVSHIYKLDASATA